MALYDDYRKRFSNPIRLPGGYQTGNVDDIARRYSSGASTQLGNASNIALYRFNGYNVPVLPSGAAGPTGAPAPGPSFIDTAPKAQMPSDTSTQGVKPPPGNAAQRWAETKDDWMAQGGSNRTLNRANVARGVRSAIDARSNPSPRNSTAAADIRKGWGWEPLY